MSTALPSYEEAAALVAAHAAQLAAHPRNKETIPLSEARNRVLASPVHADRAMPPFPRSTRDGYAVSAAELNTHTPLRVIGTLRAGDKPISEPLPAGTAWEIMTGAAVPSAADAVVMLEHVEIANVEAAGGQIRLQPSRTLELGENIIPEGAEARTGEQIIPAGVRLTAAHIAAAASCGMAQLEVFRKPTVAILTTGDELVGIHETPAPGQIRNSNAPMLAALVEQFGGHPLTLPTVADTAEALDAALAAAATADLLILSGGVSAGKFDLVEPSLARLGASFHFTGARIQPGKPVVFGNLAGRGFNPGNLHAKKEGALASEVSQPFFGLPGNPISSAATFLLFATPILAALAGQSSLPPRFAYARLAREIKGKPNLTRFVPAAVTANPPEVTPTGSKGSGDLAAFARANCFLMVPEDTTSLLAGEIVKILSF
jgi:molybdopterin molybdotransferase